MKLRIRLIVQYLVTFVFCLLNPPKELWIGDSHAFFIKLPEQKIRKYSFIKNDALVIWLGPKLLHTVSIQGIRLSIPAKIIIKYTCRNTEVFLVFGEIDVRVHLASRIRDKVEFEKLANNFKKSVLRFATEFKFEVVTVVAPVPPSDIGRINPDFPRNGDLETRIACSDRLIEELLICSDAVLNVFDSRKILRNDFGSLIKELTDDGVHLNAAGSQKLLNAIKPNSFLR